MPARPLDDLVRTARGHARAGRREAAIEGFRAVAAADAGNLEAHTFLAGALADLEPTAAVGHAERAVALAPEQLELHEQLAAAHAGVLRHPDAEQRLAGVLDAQPAAFTTRLLFTRLQERRGDRRSAIVGYLRAIKTAQARGFWHADESTPPWLRQAVQHAMRIAHDGRIALFDEWTGAMVAHHGRDAMVRVGECVAAYLGLPMADGTPRPRPSPLHVPGLPAAATCARDALPFADALEADAGAIRDELRGGGDRAFFVRGDRVAASHAACPRTSAALERLPLARVTGHGPDAGVATVAPRAHASRRGGVSNARAIVRLGLEVPPGCALHVDGAPVAAWAAGRCAVVDATGDHEVRNDSDQPAAFLIAEIWHPHLTEAERDAMAGLFAMIGELDAATAVPAGG